jgi:hypothetical protein
VRWIVKKQTLIIDNDIARKHLISLIESSTDLTVTIEKTKRKRTLSQNSAIHKYCEMLADELNAAGLDMKIILAHHAEIPWTMASVKERLWKPVLKAMTDKNSTTEQNRNEVNDTYNALARHLSATRGVYVPFPAKGEQ